MKIVILDGYVENPGDLSWDAFGALGELTVYDRTDDADIASRIGDAEAVIVNKTPITKETLERCPGIRYIGVLATGYDIVDVAAAAQRGIPVTNVPAYGTSAVAQFTFALLLEACHHAGHHDRAVKAGRWSACRDFCFWDYKLVELAGKKMGIIGFGRIGQAVARIAGAFGMNVLAYDSYQDRTLETLWIRYAEFDELLRQSDVISLHCPLMESTKEMINQSTLSACKEGVIIINTSRGQLIAQDDMLSALESGKVSVYAADVFSEEPPKQTTPLMLHPNTIFTPHIAWAPKESRARLMEIAAGNLESFVLGTPRNVVNG